MRHTARSQRGQGIVEFAAVFPLLAGMLFMLVDGGILMGRYNNINNSAKEASRLGAVAGTKAEIITRAKDQAHGYLDTASANCSDLGNSGVNNVICVQWVSGPNGEAPGKSGSSVRVKIKHKYKFITPLPNWVNDGVTTTVCAIQRMDNSTSPATADKVPGESSC